MSSEWKKDATDRRDFRQSKEKPETPKHRKKRKKHKGDWEIQTKWAFSILKCDVEWVTWKTYDSYELAESYMKKLKRERTNSSTGHRILYKGEVYDKEN